MSQEMIGNFVYLYLMISTIALMRWGFEILDKFSKNKNK